MKIAMIGHKRIPSREGGIEIVVEELSTRMAALGHQVHVYNRMGKHVADKKLDTDSHKLKEYKGVRIITVPTIARKSLDALVYSFLASVRALFGNYDVIHYHAEGPSVMLLIPHLFGIRTVVTIHGLDWQRAKWGGFATKYLLLGEKIAAKYADEVIVLSKNVQAYFKETYNRDTHYIPNGVNIPEHREAQIITEKYGLHKDDYILFLARLVPEKGLHYLLEAYKNVETDKKLVVAGGASHSSEYVDQINAKAAQDPRVIMTGFVQGRELEELFSNCYLYVLPSDVEGMPISLLEAMSYGNCCVVSNIEECTEVVGNKAYVFDKGNAADLTQCIQNLCNNKKSVIDMKDGTDNFILTKNNWNNVVLEIIKLYSI